MINNKDISIVIPEYYGESILAELLKRLHATLQTLTDSYEIILVNDCSPDNVWEAIRQVCAVDKRVVGLNLSRNFGEHYAIIADSTRPLKGAVVVGFTMSFLSVITALYNVIAYFLEFYTVPGYTTTIFSIWFACGLLLFMMGVLGLYIGRIFDQVKARPIFIVMDELNVEE